MDIANAESNGYKKLAGAVRAFCYDFRGKTVLDIGSSTGGFTKVALERGARRVVAIEKGTRQMQSPLRYDKRVELHEKTDFFEVEKGERFGLEAPVDTIVADVSFVSLRRILEKAREFADGRTEFLVMLKPQFEARKEQLWKGVVKNEKMRREIIREFEGWLKWERFLVLKKRDNEVAGRNGNLERFYLLKMGK